MNRSLIVILAAMLSGGFFMPANAQTVLPGDLKKQQAIDDSLGEYGAKILDEPLPVNRLKADSMFTRLLVRALRVPHSFYFCFDAFNRLYRNWDGC